MRKVILAGLVFLGAAGLIVFRHHASPNLNSTPLARMPAATSSAMIPGEKMPSGSAGIGGSAASVPAAAVSTEKAAIDREKPVEAFAHQEDLNQYRELKKRVLGSADDELERSRLKSDTVLLDSFRDLLKSPASGEQTRANQEAALDLLFEALKDHSTQAESILQGVIQDAQIESSALTPAVRENLAGIKAEALYQWSALDPAKAQTLQSWLPGPVSQKIWRNILDRQESNLAESQLEARR